MIDIPPGGNLFARLARTNTDEEITALLTAPNVRIERIVSTGQASPPGFWWDQEWDEWVVLLSGSAGLGSKAKPACASSRRVTICTSRHMRAIGSNGPIRASRPFGLRSISANSE